MPWEFQLPTRIQFGRGLLRKLGDLAAPLGTSALLVGYRQAGPLQEAYDRAAAALEKAGVRVVRFAQIEPEPQACLVMQGADLARQVDAAMIIGLGGGSAIDVAKAIALMARSDGDVSEYFLGRPNARALTAALPIVAVPTTAGTGAEVSDIAVLSQPPESLTDDAGRKESLYSSVLRPQMAVVDPDLTLGAPAALTAACGADALGHALEACVSRRGNPPAMLLACEAVRLISHHLRQAVANPTDPAPREALSWAATLAGMAFSASSVGAGHALAQALGARFGLPHGLTVALVTPAVLRFNLPACTAAYAQLATACGLTADSPEALAERFVEHIVDLLRSVDLPGEFPLPADVPDDIEHRLSQDVLQGSRVLLTLNPRRVNEDALRQLFAAILHS